MLSTGRHRDIIVGNWDLDGKIQGQGFKLQKNKVAFCGNWKDGKYDGNSIYFWKDESIQEGQMSNNSFNGFSEKVSREGAIERGKWEEDQLIEEEEV